VEIRKIPVKQINPATYNPRKDLKPGDAEYERLKLSIDEFGLVEPLVWNEDTGNLVGGHQRLKILLEQGVNEVEVSVVHLDLEHEKALNVALNKIQGEWDEDKLTELLKELSTSDINMALTGFGEDEIEELIKDIVVDEADVVENDVPDVPETPITQTGDLWRLGRHRLLCGDSTKVDDVLRLMNGNRADAMITDPPYGVEYSGKNEFLNKFDEGNRIQKPIDNDAITNYREFFGNFLSVAKLAEYNTIYIFMSGKELHSLRLALDDCGYYCSDYLVWVKNNHVLGRKDYNARHEFIVYGWKGKHKFYGEFSTTVLEFDRPLKSDLHPTMKPIPLLAKLIKDGSPSEGKIYDPFGGSGSTLIACEQLNRTCYMMEIDPHYCDVIVKRWEDLTGQKAVRVNE